VVASAEAHAALTALRLVVRTDGAGTYPVLGSETSLRRALLALLDNAIGHSPEGGTVTVALERGRSDIRISVTDEGPGIPSADAQRIFRRFSSGGQRAGRVHYGLGLALTHDVADRHGGHLRVADVPRGARFDLVLPLATRR
jgi:signal transduction histidine kinase